MRPIDFLEAPHDRLTLGMWVTVAIALGALAIFLPAATADPPSHQPATAPMPILGHADLPPATGSSPTVLDLVIP